MKLNHEYAGRLETCEDIRRYIGGGRGVVTLLSPSGESYTYLYKRPQNNDFPEDVMFVYVISSTNGRLYYVGMMTDLNFRCTRASRYLKDSAVVKGATYISRMMQYPKLAEITPMVLSHEGICSVCGRPLTSHKSIKSGIGPKCGKQYVERLNKCSK